MNGPPVTGRGLFKHYDDLRDQAEAAASAIVSGVSPEELQVWYICNHDVCKQKFDSEVA